MRIVFLQYTSMKKNEYLIWLITHQTPWMIKHNVTPSQNHKSKNLEWFICFFLVDWLHSCTLKHYTLVIEPRKKERNHIDTKTCTCVIIFNIFNKNRSYVLYTTLTSNSVELSEARWKSKRKIKLKQRFRIRARNAHKTQRCEGRYNED